MKKIAFIAMCILANTSFAQADVRDKARSIGVSASANCWAVSQYVMGAMMGSNVPNAKQTVKTAENLSQIYARYGEILSGREGFNDLIRNGAVPYVKSLSEKEKVALWGNCVNKAN